MNISEIDLIVQTKCDWDRLWEEYSFANEPRNVIILEIGGRSIKPSDAMRAAIRDRLRLDIIEHQTRLQLFGVHDFGDRVMA